MLRFFYKYYLNNRSAWLLIFTKGLAIYLACLAFDYLNNVLDNFLCGAYDWIKNSTATSLSSCSAFVLKSLGYKFTSYKRIIMLDDLRSIYLTDTHLGLAPLAVFTCLVLFLPGPLKYKSAFLGAGLVFIFVLNVLRVTSLALLQIHRHQSLVSLTEGLYYLLVYSLICITVRRFALSQQRERLSHPS
jgi:exosortase/archaeosortase family protein